MIKLHSFAHKIDMIFVIALFTVFAATAFLVVLIGAKQYQTTADNMNYNYEVRTAASYITEKIRQNDTSCEIAIRTVDNVDVLAISSVENDTSYITYLYYYDGWLRELFVSDSSVFTLGAGQKIVEISDFSAEKINPQLLKVYFTGSDGITYPIYLSIHTADGKEAL